MRAATTDRRTTPRRRVRVPIDRDSTARPRRPRATHGHLQDRRRPRHPTLRPRAREFGGSTAATRIVVGVPMLREDDGRSARIIGRSAQPGAVHRQADRAAPDLRRPGGDRDRERAAVQRDQGGARAADGDRRDPASHQQLADRRRSRCSTRSCRARSACSAGETRSASSFDGEAIQCAAALTPGPGRGRGAASSLSDAARAGRRPSRRRFSSAASSTSRTSESDPEHAREASRDGACAAIAAILVRADAARRRGASARSSVDAREPGRSPTSEIALLQTFADQAVIAIENVRLFNETQGERSSGRPRPPRSCKVISELADRRAAGARRDRASARRGCAARPAARVCAVRRRAAAPWRPATACPAMPDRCARSRSRAARGDRSSARAIARAPRRSHRRRA